jgi:hypothetical protein
VTSIPLKQKDLKRENRRSGVAVEDEEEKSGECEEDILPVIGKYEKASDLKKNLNVLGNLRICKFT